MSVPTQPPRPHRARRPLRSRWPVLVWILAVLVFVLLLDRLSGGLTLSGAVVKQSTVVSAPFDGQVASLHVAEGDAVQADALLCRLDDRAAQAALRAERARLDQDRTRATHEHLRSLRQLEQLSRESTADLARHRHLQAAAQAELQQISAEVARVEPLLPRHLVEPATVAELRARVARLQAEVQSYPAILESLETLQTWAEAQRQQLAASEPTTVPSEDLVADLLLNLQQCGITAPANGTVGRLHVKPGQGVARGDPLLDLVQPRSDRLLAFLPEKRARDLHPGMEFQVWCSRTPAIRGRAVVREILPEIVGLAQDQVLISQRILRGRTVSLDLIEDGGFLPGESVVLRQGTTLWQSAWNEVRGWLGR